jgi:hypothetical protein
LEQGVSTAIRWRARRLTPVFRVIGMIVAQPDARGNNHPPPWFEIVEVDLGEFDESRGEHGK